jgi:hypothetical protein
MALPLSKRRTQFHPGVPLYGGFVGFWLFVVVVMFLTYRNFNQFLRYSTALSTEQKDPVAKTGATVQRPASQLAANNPNDDFIVSVIFAANKQKYIDSLEAQTQTWMSTFPKERVFAVGPANAIRDKPNFPRIVQTPCPDRELWCKRLQQIPEAYNLLKSGLHFDWMLSGNEDWYVHVPNMRAALAGKNPNVPVVYTSMGCGKAWEYLPESKGGTVPMPSTRPDRLRCEALRKRGGACLGDGAVISRAAVEAMMQHGEERLFNITKSLPFEWETHPQDDPVLSCVVYAFEDQGVKLEEKPWKAQRDYTQNGEMKINDQTASIHAVPREGMDAAEIIRKVHLALTKS